MLESERPIGIIDSGIGGFSVARRIRELLPEEDLLYFGDGANTPYGNHSAEEILELARYMLRFMDERGVKALLVACNTISCLMDQYQDETNCPVFSVVQAGVRAVGELPIKKVGVISTVFTHSTGCYARLIQATAPDKTVVSHGCANLAGLIERYLGDPAGRELVDADLQLELDGLVTQDRIGCCVLGCTHYPLVEENIHRLYPDLPLVDPARQMTRELKGYLERRGLRNSGDNVGSLEIYTTGSVEEYAQKARSAGLEPVQSVEHYPPMKRSLVEM